MIPTYQEFMRPLLEIASNGNEIKIRDAINSLANQFHLTQDERLEKLPSGRVTVLDNRIGWAKTYLTKSGLLESTRRAHFVITERGKQALELILTRL